jgi:hypothetical protein
LKSADEIAEEICGAIAGDLGARAKGNALLFVNGFGGTPAMELYLMYNSARRIFEKHGVTVVRSLVGSYVTSLDMAGCSITLSVLDEDTAKLWDAPVGAGRLILATASITSGFRPAPPASTISKNCRRMRGSQKSLMCLATPAAPSSCGIASKNAAIWFAM